MSCERRQFDMAEVQRACSVGTATSCDTRFLARKPAGHRRHLSWSGPSAPRSGSGF
jgi:hypothetical protein